LEKAVRIIENMIL